MFTNFVATILTLATIAALSGPCAAVPSVLDRTVAHFAVSGLRLPYTVRELAAAERLYFSVELLARPAEAAPRSDPMVQLEVHGRTVREILDAAVAQDPRYTYVEKDGWINVMGRSLASDPTYPLNWRIPGRVTLTSESDARAPETVKTWLREKKIAFLLAGGLNGTRMRVPVVPQTVTLETPTLREILNWTERLRGRRMWSVGPPDPLRNDGVAFFYSCGVALPDGPPRETILIKPKN